MEYEKVNRQKYIKATIQDKIEKLRASNIPEKYVHDVERQLKNIV